MADFTNMQIATAPILPISSKSRQARPARRMQREIEHQHMFAQRTNTRQQVESER